MQVHIWAAEKGAIEGSSADGCDALVDEQSLGFDPQNHVGEEPADCYITAFEDLLEGTLDDDISREQEESQLTCLRWGTPMTPQVTRIKITQRRRHFE